MGYIDTFGEDGQRKSRKLVELDVEEVSLVDQPATGRRFAIVKRASLPQEVSDFLGEEGELEKDQAEAQAAVLEAIKKLAIFKRDFPGDILAAVQVLAKWAGEAAYAEEPPPPAEPTQKKSVKKGGQSGRPLWPSLCGTSPPAGDAGSNDAGGGDRRPQRGISKQARGQDDARDDNEPVNLWPSLG